MLCSLYWQKNEGLEEQRRYSNQCTVLFLLCFFLHCWIEIGQTWILESWGFLSHWAWHRADPQWMFSEWRKISNYLVETSERIRLLLKLQTTMLKNSGGVCMYACASVCNFHIEWLFMFSRTTPQFNMTTLKQHITWSRLCLLDLLKEARPLQGNS